MKKTKIVIAAVLGLLLLFFLPVPKGPYDDGGTREYRALTYTVVVWNKLIGAPGEADDVTRYRKTSVFWYPDNCSRIDELWKLEQSGK